MASKKTSLEEYRARLDAIQDYINFAFDPNAPLSPAQKRRISVYFNAIRAEKYQSGAIYKGTSANLKFVHQAVGSKIPRAGLKAVPVPTSLKKAKISVKKRKVKTVDKLGRKRTVTRKELHIKSQHVREIFVRLNPYKMMDDARDELKNKLSGIRFNNGKFAVFNNFTGGQGFGLAGIGEFGSWEAAYDAWINSYVIHYPYQNPKCCTGVQMTLISANIPQQSLEDYQDARGISQRTKKKRIYKKKGNKNGKRR